MKIENKPFTYFDYLDSIKAQRDRWLEEENFQGNNLGPHSEALYNIAIFNKIKLELEITRVTKLLEV